SGITNGGKLMVLMDFNPALIPEVKFFLLLIITILILLSNRIIQIILSRKSGKLSKIPLDILNAIKVIVNLSSAAFILFIITILYGLSIEGIVGVSAFIGAILSFGSTQILSNFIAGLYIVFIKPFGVNDLISLEDEVTGQVVEISLNYTKIKTINDIYHYIPNKSFLTTNLEIFRQKLERKIGTLETEAHQKSNSRFKMLKDLALQLIEEEVVRYTFVWGAPVGNLKTTKNKIQEVCDIYTGVFGFKPEFFLYSLDFRMQFKIIVTTHDPELLLKNIREFRNAIVEKFH
ncbi:MAG: mechanosensitive ion channel domain-containing protein, partial [Candidatus Hodarchaeales archaeon]